MLHTTSTLMSTGSRSFIILTSALSNVNSRLASVLSGVGDAATDASRGPKSKVSASRPCIQVRSKRILILLEQYMNPNRIAIAIGGI